jgi:hypothetical protein
MGVFNRVCSFLRQIAAINIPCINATQELKNLIANSGFRPSKCGPINNSFNGSGKCFLAILPGLFVFGLFAVPVPISRPADGPQRIGGYTANATETVDSQSTRRLRARINEAKQSLSKFSLPDTKSIAIAVDDPQSVELALLTVPKETFLTRDAQTELRTSEGKSVSLRVERANGVNTAVTIKDTVGRSLLPLAVKYPIERNGKTEELAYYTSVHPALESNELASDGEKYVKRMLHLAAERLADKGVVVQPEIVNVAEQLCIVEHTDHKRFLSEDHTSLFNEIASLYSLNLSDTYRYSISSAAAGGMIQMIPTTYNRVRELHPNAQLKADFVEGMRDHENALEAMLLYMVDTWDNLARQETVGRALENHVATQAELLAAGYNSNPAKLSSYLERGGTAWRTLIPQETQMYLQILAAVDKFNANSEAG